MEAKLGRETTERGREATTGRLLKAEYDKADSCVDYTGIQDTNAIYSTAVNVKEILSITEWLLLDGPVAAVTVLPSCLGQRSNILHVIYSLLYVVTGTR